MVKKIMKRVIVILEILVFGSFIIFGNAGGNIISAYAAEDSNDDKVLYLSDTTRIKHDASKSKSLVTSTLRYLCKDYNKFGNCPRGV